MAELGSVRDSTSSGKKRIFAIVSRPIAAELKGKAIRRIVIFDNHPDSLRLVLESGVDSGNDDAAALWERRASIICGSILIAGASKAKEHFVTAAASAQVACTYHSGTHNRGDGTIWARLGALEGIAFLTSFYGNGETKSSKKC